MIIGGFQPCSLCDYPGEVSSVIFTQGCSLRCSYCHNQVLLPKSSEICLDIELLIERLKKGRKRVGGVVVTGGEPTFHSDLPSFLGRLRAIGLRIKLDTNGVNPAMVRDVLAAGLVDYVAMDIKGPLQKYGEITGVNISWDCITTCINIIAESGVQHEFRTTVVPDLLDTADIADIRLMLPAASTYRLQPYRSVSENF